MASRTSRRELSELLKSLDIAMLTTVGAAGELVSRPLSTQDVAGDGKRLWFMTDITSPKAVEIARNPRVNVAYASKSSNAYASLSGHAQLTQDKRRINRYWNDAMKAFFPAGKDDPNLGLIEVEVRTVEYWDGPDSLLGKAITFMVARVTGNDDVLAENRIIDMTTGRSRTPPSAESRRGTGTKAGQPATRKPAAKRASTAKSAAKKAPAKTAAGRKSAAKKANARKAPARKTAAGRTSARKTAARKAPARRAR